MTTIRVAWGTATGPTAMAAYDAALAEANVHDFNLVTVSSVIPAGTDLAVVGTAPDLGPAGDRLTVVQSRADRAPGADEPGVVGLGWARSADGPGILYEATGTDAEAVRTAVRTGLEHGVGLRDWDVADSDVLVRRVEPVADAHSTVVLLAVYGESEPVV